jgi:hypothetical protein
MVKANGDCNVATDGLRVESGETVVLSPSSSRFKAVYERVQPKSISEVRAILGLSESSAKAVARRRCCQPSVAGKAVMTPDDLDSPDPAVATRARALAYAVAEEYVRSPDPTHLSSWVPALDRFIGLSQASLNVATFLSDIDVADGATLTISSSTHALRANAVRIHGTGRIVCQGDLTFKIASLEGLVSSSVGSLGGRSVAPTGTLASK